MLGTTHEHDPVVSEAIEQIRQYLSDRLAPLMVAESVTALVGVSAAPVAREIHAWASLQKGTAGLGLADFLFHGLRKILVMGELNLVPRGALQPYMDALIRAVVELTPSTDRTRLVEIVNQLGQSETVSVHEVDVIHRPAQESRPAKKPKAPKDAPKDGASTRPPPPPTARNLPPDVVLGLRRLALLMDRLDSARASEPAPAGPGAPPVTAARQELAAEAMVTGALAAQSGEELDEQIALFREKGLVKGMEDMFRSLGESLPGWWVPGLPTAPAAGAGIEAIARLITLPQDRTEGSRRFREMVHAAVEQFNKGSLGRAVRMFDLAERMILDKEVDDRFVEPLRENGHEHLDHDRVRKLVENKDRRSFPRTILRFFRAFAPRRLLDELRIETRRERRRLLLAFLETQGDDGRQAAFERLKEVPADEDDWYLLRNLVHLLRTIPRSADTLWEPEQEIARVVRFLVPEQPPFLIKEVLAYLGQQRHDVAEQALLLFAQNLEASLLSDETTEAERELYLPHLDRACAVLARYPTAKAWLAVVTHGLGTDPRLGDAAARLDELGGQDLSSAPEVERRLQEALEADLPRNLFARIVTPKAGCLLHLVTALSGTRSPAIRSLFEGLAKSFPQQAFGEKAAKALTAMDAPAHAPAAAPASLSGDLDVFGLPTLLQNLADMRVTGSLTLIDSEGTLAASLAIDTGRVTRASYGRLSGREVVYQLCELPFPGTFAFVHRPNVNGSPPGDAFDVALLVLEGIRRYDELRRAAALVPGHLRLASTGQRPSAVPGESDVDLITSIWESMDGRATVLECEEAESVDSYRVRRALAHWVEEGALRPVVAESAA